MSKNIKIYLIIPLEKIINRFRRNLNRNSFNLISAIIISIIVFSLFIYQFNSLTIDDNKVRVRVEKTYHATVLKEYIDIGTSEKNDISILNKKSEKHHLRIYPKDDFYILQNTSKNRRIDLNNNYFSTVEVEKDSILTYKNKNYKILTNPQRYYLGYKFSVEDENKEIIEIKCIYPHLIFFNKIFIDDTQNNDKRFGYFKIKRSDKFSYTFLIILLVLSAIIFIFMIYGFFKKFRTLPLLSLFLLLLLFATFFYLKSYKNLKVQIKTVSRNPETAEIIKYNNKTLYNRKIKCSYDKTQKVIMGYTLNELNVKRTTDSVFIELKMIMGPFELLNINKSKNITISNLKTDTKSDLVLNYPKKESIDTLAINSITKIKGENGYIDLNIQDTNLDWNKYYKFFLYGTIAFFFLIIFFNYNSLILGIFLFLILQSILNLDLLSLYHYKNYNTYNMHLHFLMKIGIPLFFILLFSRYFKFQNLKAIIPFYKFKSHNTSDEIVMKYFVYQYLFYIIAIGGHFFFDNIYNHIIAVFLSFILFINNIIHDEDEIEDGIVSGRGTNYEHFSIAYFFLENNYIKQVYLTISLISLLIVLQALTGSGELGFKFMGTRIAIMAPISIILVMILIDTYYKEKYQNDYDERSSISLWVWIFPLTALFLAALLVNDQSPLAIFLIIFVFNYLANLEKKGEIFFVLIVFFGIIISFSNHFNVLLIIQLGLVLLYILYKIHHITVKSFKIILFSIFSVGIIGFLINVTTYEFIPQNIILRINNFRNFATIRNEQQIKAIQFITSLNHETVNSVPVINSDMAYSNYFHFFGKTGFLIISFSLIILAFYFIVLYIREFTKKISSNKTVKNRLNWIRIVSLFLTILFGIQNYLPISNVIGGITPLMGMPGIVSYSISYLLLFTIPIFALLLNLDKESRKLKGDED